MDLAQTACGCIRKNKLDFTIKEIYLRIENGDNCLFTGIRGRLPKRGKQNC
jgi:hypothetical protein